MAPPTPECPACGDGWACGANMIIPLDLASAWPVFRCLVQVAAVQSSATCGGNEGCAGCSVSLHAASCVAYFHGRWVVVHCASKHHVAGSLDAQSVCQSVCVATPHMMQL